MNSVYLKSVLSHSGIGLGFRTFVLAPIGAVLLQNANPYQ